MTVSIVYWDRWWPLSLSLSFYRQQHGSAPHLLFPVVSSLKTGVRAKLQNFNSVGKRIRDTCHGCLIRGEGKETLKWSSLNLNAVHVIHRKYGKLTWKYTTVFFPRVTTASNFSSSLSENGLFWPELDLAAVAAPHHHHHHHHHQRIDLNHHDSDDHQVTTFAGHTGDVMSLSLSPDQVLNQTSQSQSHKPSCQFSRIFPNS